MLRNLSMTFVVLPCLGLLAGCQTTTGLPDQEEGTAEVAEILVKPNLVDENCRVLSVTDPEFADKAERVLKVFCGRWEHPSGRVFETTASGASKSLKNWGEVGWWQQEVDRRALCDEAESIVILDDVPAMIWRCELRNGGWPYVTIAARADGSTFLADGIPAVMGVIEETIGVLSGRLEVTSAAAPPRHSAAIQRLEAALSDRLYGAGDLQTYYQLMELGQYYNGIKDFAAGEARYREALTIHERLLGVDSPEAMDPLMHIALELSNQGRFAEAEALFQRVGPVVTQAVDQSDYARYISYRAFHAANQGEFEEALQLAREATVIRQIVISESVAPAAGGPGAALPAAGREDVTVLGEAQAPNAADVVQSLYLESAMLRELGDSDQAEEVMGSATSALLDSDEAPPSWEPQLLGLDASIASLRGSHLETEQGLKTAIDLWEQHAPGERPSAIDYLQLGTANQREGHLDDALAAFRTGIKLLQDRGGSVSYGQLQPYFRTALAVSEARPTARDTLHAEMFEAAQLVRGGRTSQDIARASARLSASEGQAGKVVRDLQDAVDERFLLYNAYTVALAQAEVQVNRERQQVLSAKIVDVNRRIQELNRQVQAAFPGYNQLIDTAVSARRVLELMRPAEALVQVLLGDSGSLLFLVEGGRVSAYPLALTESEAARAVSELRDPFEKARAGRRIPEFDVAKAHELYLGLLSPVADQIRDVDHLVTVPFGPLLSFPFGLLVTKESAPERGSGYTAVEWLAKRSAISLVPSVRSFVDLRAVAAPSRAPKAFIGFGDFMPFESSALAQIDVKLPTECLTDPERLERHRRLLSALSALPTTKHEIERVSATFPKGQTDLFLAENFNESAIMARPLQDYRVLYFATHALLPSELECQPEPSLTASLSQPPAAGEDGLINMSEILKLDLDADLVVLSACNTGGPGTATGGESLSGLARAFFFAGARSLLVSHWSVGDKSTADMMTKMFRRMREAPGTGWASSLRVAQLSLMSQRKRSHPIFWGAFTLVGDGAQSVSEYGNLQVTFK